MYNYQLSLSAIRNSYLQLMRICLTKENMWPGYSIRTNKMGWKNIGSIWCWLQNQLPGHSYSFHYTLWIMFEKHLQNVTIRRRIHSFTVSKPDTFHCEFKWVIESQFNICMSPLSRSSFHQRPNMACALLPCALSSGGWSPKRLHPQFGEQLNQNRISFQGRWVTLRLSCGVLVGYKECWPCLSSFHMFFPACTLLAFNIATLLELRAQFTSLKYSGPVLNATKSVTYSYQDCFHLNLNVIQCI